MSLEKKQVYHRPLTYEEMEKKRTRSNARRVAKRRVVDAWAIANPVKSTKPTVLFPSEGTHRRTDFKGQDCEVVACHAVILGGIPRRAGIFSMENGALVFTSYRQENDIFIEGKKQDCWALCNELYEWMVKIEVAAIRIVLPTRTLESRMSRWKAHKLESFRYPPFERQTCLHKTYFDGKEEP